MILAESRKEQYLTELSNGKTSVLADVTKAEGEPRFGPMDFLCAGFASCLDMTIRMVLEREKDPYERVNVRVELDRSDPEKTKFLYRIDIESDIPEEEKRRVIAIASRCPVRKTLSRQIVFEEQESL